MRTAWAAVLGVLVATAVARAQPSPAAEKLFRDGRALLKKGKLSEACAAFAASVRLEPSIGTLLNLGDCRAKLGRTATAWAAFVEAGRQAKRRSDKRGAEARRRATELEAKLSYLTIVVPTAAPDLQVARDNERVDAATFGVALPVDPGEHEIRAEAHGQTWRKQIVIKADGDRQSVVVELEQPSPVAPRPTPVTTTIQPAPEAPAPAPLAPGRFTTLRIGGLIVGVAGIGGLGVSTVLGLKARSLDADAHAICPSGEPCRDQAAADKSKDAVSRARLATVVGAVGAGAVVAGVVLWFVGKPSAATGERAARIVPTVSSESFGVGLVGAF